MAAFSASVTATGRPASAGNWGSADGLAHRVASIRTACVSGTGWLEGVAQLVSADKSASRAMGLRIERNGLLHDGSDLVGGSVSCGDTGGTRAVSLASGADRLAVLDGPFVLGGLQGDA